MFNRLSSQVHIINEAVNKASVCERRDDHLLGCRMALASSEGFIAAFMDGRRRGESSCAECGSSKEQSGGGGGNSGGNNKSVGFRKEVTLARGLGEAEGR